MHGLQTLGSRGLHHEQPQQQPQQATSTQDSVAGLGGQSLQSDEQRMKQNRGRPAPRRHVVDPEAERIAQTMVAQSAQP